jgi:hypothetical protein
MALATASPRDAASDQLGVAAYGSKSSVQLTNGLDPSVAHSASRPPAGSILSATGRVPPLTSGHSRPTIRT